MFAGIVSAIWGFLTSKLAGPSFALVAIGLALFLVGARAEVGAQKAQVKTLSEAISAPVTGWAARLESCQTGREVAVRAVESQTNQVNEWKGKATAAQDRADQLVTEAAKSRASAQAAVARLASYKAPAGATICQDLEAADAAALAALKELRP